MNSENITIDDKFLIAFNDQVFGFKTLTEYLIFLDMLFAFAFDRRNLYLDVASHTQELFLELICTASKSDPLPAGAMACYRAARILIDKYGPVYDPAGEIVFCAYDSLGQEII